MRRVAVLALLALLAACGVGPPASPSPRVPTELTVLAAASLGDILDKVAAAYARERPGTTFIISTDSSAALATQIEQGAPADVFLAADQANPKRLIDGGLAGGPAVTFATNGLAIVVPAGNPAEIASPEDLARSGVRIVAAGEDVPITTYATQLVERLAGEPGFPADFTDAYAANIVSREDNVRAVLARIALGEGDAAIVYTTDATASGDVERITIPEEVSSAVVARYDGIVLDRSARGAAASAFLSWLAGEQGQAILATAGFGPP